MKGSGIQRALRLAVITVAATPLAAQEPARPPAAQRIDTWQREQPSKLMPVHLQFGRLIPDAAVIQLLQRHSVTPVAIYMYANGLWATHRVAPAKASTASIAEARRNVGQMMRTGLAHAQAHAQRLQADAGSGRIADNPAGLRRLTSFLAVVERERAVRGSTAAGRPIIYAIDAIGDVAAVRALVSDPMVQVAEPALRVNGRTRVPRTRPPDEARLAFAAPAIEARGRADALARIRDIAQNGAKENP
jgi:hypothetical protein